MIETPPVRQGAGRLSRAAWSTSDRLLAVLAHAAIGFGFVGVGFLLSLAISLVIWLVSRRSPHLSAHAEQAGTYQLFVVVVNVLVIAGWAWASFLLFGRLVLMPPAAASGLDQAARPWLITLWALAVPLFGLWYVGTIVLGLVGAVRVALGQPFWYPVVGGWARRKLADGARR